MYIRILKNQSHYEPTRTEKLKQLKFVNWTTIFLRTMGKSKAVTESSYRVSHIIAPKKKPYEDGEMKKQVFLEAAYSLFANFRSKDEIINTCYKIYAILC